MQTPDLTENNITKIAQLFPNVVTEKKGVDGVAEKAVDFELLKQILSKELVEDDNERYRLDWPGKKDSLLKANTPITKTLRPDRDSSVNFDTTENVFIEGDNFEVLKVLQESYLGKIKMIYIDPPYNTGKDFVYKDNFTKSKDEYEEEIGVEDEEGGKLFRNTDSNGRFHSDWLSMMYERLIVARDLLRDDGVVFISIDDNESHNLRKICDEVFGENNFVSQIPWQARQSIQNDTDLSSSHEYIIAYAKVRRQVNRRLKETNKNEWYLEKSFACYPLPLDISKFSNPDNDIRGLWKADPFDAPNIRPNLTYSILNINTKEEIWPPKGRCWRTSEIEYKKLLEDGRIVFGKTGDSKPQLKVFYNEKKEYGSTPNTWFDGNQYGTATKGTKVLQSLFENAPFDTPKPIELITQLLLLATKQNDIILDFFAGSGTTAHAVMQLNAEDGGGRKFVMIQIPEEVDIDSEAYKAEYKYISDISKERIRRAGKKILEENADTIATREKPLDIGFRAYKADTTNMKDVYYHPSQVVQEDLFNLVSNIKEDRTPEDLLTQVILDLGLTLDLPVEKKELRGNSVYFVAGNALVSCFDDKIDFGIVDDIATYEPLKVVFKDASFKEEQDRTNVDTRMKRLSPETIITVL